MTLVRLRSELIATSLLAVAVGSLVLAFVLIDDEVSPGKTLLVAAVATLGLGGFLHAIEGRQRLADLSNASEPSEEAQLEPSVRTLGRQGLLMAGSAAVSLAVVWVLWDAIWMTPGIFLGMALWLWLDFRSVTRWEGQYNAEAFKVGDLGFAWLRKDSQRSFVTHRADS